VPTDPAIHFIKLSCSPRIRNLIVLIVLINQILLYTARFKQSDGLPIFKSIRQCRDTAIGVYFKEPRFLLLVFGELDLGHFVRQAKLLEGYGDLDAIGGLGRVQMEVGTSSHGKLLCELLQTGRHEAQKGGNAEGWGAGSSSFIFALLIRFTFT
jgi:hypothetical protein